jgi:pre-rRNA-processing protein IPI3
MQSLNGADGDNATSLLIPASTMKRVTELEEEVARLRAQLGRAKGINDTMWETVVKRLLKPGQDDTDSQGMEESERQKRKRME